MHSKWLKSRAATGRLIAMSTGTLGTAFSTSGAFLTALSATSTAATLIQGVQVGMSYVAISSMIFGIEKLFKFVNSYSETSPSVQISTLHNLTCLGFKDPEFGGTSIHSGPENLKKSSKKNS